MKGEEEIIGGMTDDVLDTLQEVINYIEKTTDDQWLTDICANKEQTKGCIQWHIMKYGESIGEPIRDMFENTIATTRMLYEVNDGDHKDYKQVTPRERCIAYLKDIHAGKQMSVSQMLELY